TSAPADPTDQRWSSINQTSMNVTVIVCGTISRAEATWMRRRTCARRYGLASSSALAVARVFRGGSGTPTGQSNPHQLHIAAPDPARAHPSAPGPPQGIPGCWGVLRPPPPKPAGVGGNPAAPRRAGGGVAPPRGQPAEEENPPPPPRGGARRGEKTRNRRER